VQLGFQKQKWPNSNLAVFHFSKFNFAWPSKLALSTKSWC
jgi:hypothetical protein